MDSRRLVSSGMFAVALAQSLYGQGGRVDVNASAQANPQAPKPSRQERRRAALLERRQAKRARLSQIEPQQDRDA